MSLVAGFERLYGEYRGNKWLQWFAVFCRVALALGFIPSGMVKVTGERFTGLPANHPLGHYFDALFLTGFYYTFIGGAQLVTALLLLIPRTALLGAICYLPIILNIFVLTHATRFNGTRIVTLMLLANLFLLVWDYDRLKYALAFYQPYQPAEDRPVVATRKFPFLFFGCVVAVAMSVIVFNDLLFDIRPGNEEAECTNGCRPGDACQHFCDCIYQKGNPLNVCLSEYRALKTGTGR